MHAYNYNDLAESIMANFERPESKILHKYVNPEDLSEHLRMNREELTESIIEIISEKFVLKDEVQVSVEVVEEVIKKWREGLVDRIEDFGSLGKFLDIKAVEYLIVILEDKIRHSLCSDEHIKKKRESGNSGDYLS